MEWFVRATRNGTEVKIPATNRNFAPDAEQQAECLKIQSNLQGHGWQDVSIEAY